MIDLSVAQCPTCGTAVPVMPNVAVQNGQVAFWMKFGPHGGCPKEGHKVLDRDYDAVQDGESK